MRCGNWFSAKKGVDKRAKTSYHVVVRAEPLGNQAAFSFGCGLVGCTRLAALGLGAGWELVLDWYCTV